MNISTNDILQIKHNSTPKIIWQMNIDTLKSITSFKDSDGEYLVYLSIRSGNNTLLRHPIELVKTKCFRLLYVFPNGNTEVFEYNHL